LRVPPLARIEQKVPKDRGQFNDLHIHPKVLGEGKYMPDTLSKATQGREWHMAKQTCRLTQVEPDCNRCRHPSR
jgi:hypothetical protein